MTNNNTNNIFSCASRRAKTDVSRETVNINNILQT